MRTPAAPWSGYTPADHRTQMNEYLREKSARAFVAQRPNGRLAGFVEATIRPHPDACDTSTDGYVERSYVYPDVPVCCTGRRLARAAERRARERGSHHIGSDCLGRHP